MQNYQFLIYQLQTCSDISATKEKYREIPDNLRRYISKVTMARFRSELNIPIKKDDMDFKVRNLPGMRKLDELRKC